MARYSFNLDDTLRAESESIYAQLGQTLSSAINTFLRQSVACGGFPFDVRLSEADRTAAIEAARFKEVCRKTRALPWPDVPKARTVDGVAVVPRDYFDDEEDGDE